MQLISELLKDMDKAMRYCSQDMDSGFWVVEMTERARLISALITPSVLFEWLRMAFGLKNAPQIYRSLIDNDLYVYVKIQTECDGISTGSDEFTTGSPEVRACLSKVNRIRIQGRQCFCNGAARYMDFH